MPDFLERDIDAAIKWGRGQIDDPDQDYTALCQMFNRLCDDIEAWGSSALIVWNSIPESEKHRGGSPFDAPRGVHIYFDDPPYGHVALTIGKTTNTKCLSNDYVRTGRIDEAPRDFPRWGLHYVGWSGWTPDGELRPGSGELWDGEVPPKENIDFAEDGNANKAAWRLANRLHDLGFYEGTPQPLYTQGYPVKAVIAFQKSLGWDGSGAYGTKTHEAVWPL